MTKDVAVHVRVVGAVITRPDGAVLAALRGPDMTNPGRWEFPGGKVEPGETPAAALRREITEELGCDVTIGAPVAISSHRNGERVVVLETYRCAITSGEPAALEHAELRWIPLAELDSLDWSPADLATVAALQQP